MNYLNKLKDASWLEFAPDCSTLARGMQSYNITWLTANLFRLAWQSSDLIECPATCALRSDAMVATLWPLNRRQAGRPAETSRHAFVLVRDLYGWWGAIRYKMNRRYIENITFPAGRRFCSWAFVPRECWQDCGCFAEKGCLCLLDRNEYGLSILLSVSLRIRFCSMPVRTSRHRNLHGSVSQYRNSTLDRRALVHIPQASTQHNKLERMEADSLSEPMAPTDKEM
jgi:hypothetical protein